MGTLTSYTEGPSLLSAEEAAQLLEPTAEWIGEAKNSYVAGAEVFHNLHCLETLRTAIWTEEPYLFHGKEDAEDPHVDHMSMFNCFTFAYQLNNNLDNSALY